MNTNRNVARLEGRLFAEAGRLCMVVEANETSGIGRVSFREDGKQQVVEMSLSELGRRISLGANLALDTVAAPEATPRIARKRDGWYFSAREGLNGPFRTREEAEEGLSQHILESQSARA